VDIEVKVFHNIQQASPLQLCHFLCVGERGIPTERREKKERKNDVMK
jgi:hypothetical protein